MNISHAISLIKAAARNVFEFVKVIKLVNKFVKFKINKKTL